MVDPLTLGFKLYARNEFFRYQKTGQREFTIIIHQTVYRQRRPLDNIKELLRDLCSGIPKSLS